MGRRRVAGSAGAHADRRLTMDLRTLYAPAHVTHWSLARHALVEAHRSCGATNGATVLLPSFVCRDLLGAVAIAGARHAYYDVDERLQPHELPAGARAVLAVDYFGFATPMEPFRDYCRASGATLIEDNAHGLFSRDADGALLGMRGDLGILSMRKSLRLADGGALLDCRPGAAHDEPACDPDAGQGGAGIRAAVASVERRTGLPVMAVMRAGVRAARRAAGRPTLPSSGDEDERHVPGSPSISCSSLERLSRADAPHEAERRRDLWRAVTADLDGVRGVRLINDRLPDGTVPYGVAVHADHDDVLRAVARRHRATAMAWPALPADVTSDAPRHYRDVKLVNFL